MQHSWAREVEGFSRVRYEEQWRRLELHSMYGRLLREHLIWGSWGFEMFDLGLYSRTRGLSFT